MDLSVELILIPMYSTSLDHTDLWANLVLGSYNNIQDYMQHRLFRLPDLHMKKMKMSLLFVALFSSASDQISEVSMRRIIAIVAIANCFTPVNTMSRNPITVKS